MEAADQALRDVMNAARIPARSERQFARDQKRMISRMKYSPFNSHPERATIPVLGFDSQPDVIALNSPISMGESDPARRELEGFATPASTYIGNEMHFDGWTAPAGGQYRLRFNAFSLWIHTHWVKAPGGKEMSWRPNRDKTSKGRTVEPVSIYALNQAREKRLLGSFDVKPEPGVYEMTVNCWRASKSCPTPRGCSGRGRALFRVPIPRPRERRASPIDGWKWKAPTKLPKRARAMRGCSEICPRRATRREVARRRRFGGRWRAAAAAVRRDSLIAGHQGKRKSSDTRGS